MHSRNAKRLRRYLPPITFNYRDLLAQSTSPVSKTHVEVSAAGIDRLVRYGLGLLGVKSFAILELAKILAADVH